MDKIVRAYDLLNKWNKEKKDPFLVMKAHKLLNEYINNEFVSFRNEILTLARTTSLEDTKLVQIIKDNKDEVANLIGKDTKTILRWIKTDIKKFEPYRKEILEKLNMPI